MLGATWPPEGRAQGTPSWPWDLRQAGGLTAGMLPLLSPRLLSIALEAHSVPAPICQASSAASPLPPAHAMPHVIPWTYHFVSYLPAFGQGSSLCLQSPDCLPGPFHFPPTWSDPFVRSPQWGSPDTPLSQLFAPLLSIQVSIHASVHVKCSSFAL